MEWIFRKERQKSSRPTGETIGISEKKQKRKELKKEITGPRRGDAKNEKFQPQAPCKGATRKGVENWGLIEEA